MDVELHDGGPLPGLADVVADAGDDPAAALDEADLPLHATMGVRDSVGALVDWVKGRKLVRTLEEDVVPLTWFECHVPHAGTALERFEAAQTESGGVTIKAFGSGLGQGRDVTVTLSSEASAPRTACVSYVVDLRVLPHVYESGGRESVVTDILGPAAHRYVEVEDCPFCALAPGAVDEFENVLDVPLDLRADSVGRKEVIKLDWSSESSIDVGLKLPRAGVDVALNARVTGKGSFSIAYELKPGFLYQSYRPVGAGGRTAPRWAYSS
jgi:hypothetical protein